jgi:hypothetical protein
MDSRIETIDMGKGELPIPCLPEQLAQEAGIARVVLNQQHMDGTTIHAVPL